MTVGGTPNTMEDSGFRRRRLAFRRWRRARPFWGGFFSLLAGLEFYLTVHQNPLTMSISFGPQGFMAWVLPLVFVMCGLLGWFTPHRIFYGVIAAVSAVYSLIGLNLGGFVVGMLLGLVGGALLVSWTPIEPEQPPAPSSGNPDEPHTYADPAAVGFDLPQMDQDVPAQEPPVAQPPQADRTVALPAEGEPGSGAAAPEAVSGSPAAALATAAPGARSRSGKGLGRLKFGGKDATVLLVAVVCVVGSGLFVARSPSAEAATNCVPVPTSAASGAVTAVGVAATTTGTTTRKKTRKATSGATTTKAKAKAKTTSSSKSPSTSRTTASEITTSAGATVRPGSTPTAAVAAGVVTAAATPSAPATTAPATTTPTATATATETTPTATATATTAPTPTSPATTTGAPSSAPSSSATPTVTTPDPSSASASATTAATNCPGAMSAQALGAAVKADPAVFGVSDLTTNSLVMHGLSYDGIVSLPKADGTTIRVLRFSMTSVTHTPFKLAVSEKTSSQTYTAGTLTVGDTSASSWVTVYCTSLSGTLLGIIPLTFTPDSPPLLVLPDLALGNVKIGLVDVQSNRLTASSFAVAIG
jgi:hypothetical protein